MSRTKVIFFIDGELSNERFDEITDTVMRMGGYDMEVETAEQEDFGIRKVERKKKKI